MILGYLSGDGMSITDGEGERIMTVVSTSQVRAGGWMMRNGPGHRFLTSVRARDAKGKKWYGRGAGPSMSIRLHPFKEGR